MRIIYYLVLLTINCSIIADEIYQFRDKNNNLVVTNKPKKDASKMPLAPLTRYAQPMSKSDVLAKKYTDNRLSQQGLMLPKANTQYMLNKSSSRYKILQDELNREKSALEDTKLLLEQAKSLQSSNKTKERKATLSQIETLNNAITEHKKNIDTLTKQLEQ